MNLQERLRERAKKVWLDQVPPDEGKFPIMDLVGEAADALDAAEARIKALEEALRECLAAWGRDGVKADNNSPEVRGRAKSVLEG